MKNAIIFAVLLAGAAYGGTQWHMHNKVSDAVDIAVIMMAPFVEVSYDGVSSTLTGELTVDGVRAKISGFRDELVIDRIGIDTPSFMSLLKLTEVTSNPLAAARDVPKSIGFLIEGVRMPVQADYFRALYDLQLEVFGLDSAGDAAAECAGKYGFSPRALAGLGYSEQVGSVSVMFRQDHAGFVVEIDSSTEQMWDVDIEMTLVGDMITEMSKGTAFRPRMRNLRIEYVDQSLNERVRKYCASRGLNEEETFAAQMDAFQFLGEMYGIEFDEYMVDPYKDFLRGKSSLVVTASPSEPITLSQIKLYKPSDVPALLDLQANAM